MKNLFNKCAILVPLIFCLVVRGADGQSAISTAFNVAQKLDSLAPKIVELDHMVSNSYFCTMDTTAINLHYSRYLQAEELIKTLKSLDYEMSRLAERNLGVSHYQVLSVTAKVLQLSLYSNHVSYLDFIRILSEGDTKATYLEVKEGFENISRRWSQEREILQRSASTQLDVCLRLDSTCSEAKILNAVLQYYLGDMELAYEHLKDVQREIERAKKSERVNDLKYEWLMGHVLAWRAFIDYELDRGDDLKNEISHAVAMAGDPTVAQWGLFSTERLNGQERRAYVREQYLTTIVPDAITYSSLDISLDTTEQAQLQGVQIAETHKTYDSSPRRFYPLLEVGWEKLCSLDYLPWMFADYDEDYEANEIELEHRRALFVVNNESGIVTNNNQYRHLERLKLACSVADSLMAARLILSRLIEDNPDVYYFRLCRVKCNLGLHYLCQNRESYLGILDVARTSEGAIHGSVSRRVKQRFSEKLEEDLLSEMNVDLEVCRDKAPDDVLYLLTLVEYASMIESPENALEILSEIKFPDNASYMGYDPRDLLNKSRAFIYLRAKQPDKIRAYLSKLGDRNSSKDWRQLLRLVADYLDHDRINQN